MGTLCIPQNVQHNYSPPMNESKIELEQVLQLFAKLESIAKTISKSLENDAIDNPNFENHYDPAIAEIIKTNNEIKKRFLAYTIKTNQEKKYLAKVYQKSL